MRTSNGRVDAFFRKVTGWYATGRRATAPVITHLLAERPAFLHALARQATVGAVLPKPKSIDEGALRQISTTMPVDALDRAAFADPGHVLEYIERRAAGQSVVLLDVGGYFAPSIGQVCDRFSGHILCSSGTTPWPRGCSPAVTSNPVIPG